MLVTDYTQRLGSKDFKDIKEHPFFSDINWSDIYNKKIKSPLTQFVKK